MKNIKYIFCDLDSTLLKNDKTISKRNLRAIKLARANNIDFVIATGRMPFRISELIDQIKGDVDTYSICTNGAMLLKNKTTILSEFHLNSEIVKYIKEIAINNNLGLFVSTFNSIRCFNLNKIKEAPLERHISPVELNIDEFNKYLDKTIYKISLVSINIDKLLEIKKEIEKRFDLSLAFSTKYTIEIVASNRNKGKGILDFCSLMNIDLNNTMSIGDNENDFPMLKVTKYSATVKNGLEDIKKMVNFVASGDNDHDGVAEIIYKFIFENKEDITSE